MAITNFDKVELLLPMTGANNGTVFTDHSMKQIVVTATSAVTSTAQSKFAAYGSSGLFAASGHRLTANIGAGQFGTGDFSVEAYVHKTDTAVGAIGGTYNGSGAGRWGFSLSSTNLQFRHADSVIVNRSVTVSSDVWYHVAACRSGTTLRLFLDGTQVGSDATLSDDFNAAAAMTAGAWAGVPTTSSWRGYIQDFMITHTDKYTANFTPPARITQRTLTRTSTGTDSHEYDRAVLFDWNAGDGSSLSTSVAPDSEGDFVADDLIDLEYGVAFIKDGCGPVCRGPVEVDPDA
jgi:hypothetical protein